MKKISCLFLLFLLTNATVNACTIFIGSNGQMTLVGNNEDYSPSENTFIWLRPRTPHTNGYIFWGFREKFPEGGMNEHGLFIDAAALPEKIPIMRDPGKPDFEGYLTETILRSCATVEEVITLVKKYNLTWQEKAQILVADQSGDYAVIHANYILRKMTPFFALTNYSLQDSTNTNFSCWRRNTAYRDLGGGDFTVKKFSEVLSETAQTELYNATVYSQVCDLKKRIVYLYRLHDFSRVDTIDLAKILLKGKQNLAISSLFPKRIGDTVLLVAERTGVASAIGKYKKIKSSKDASLYNFSERELNRAGYALLNEGRFKDAISIFTLNLNVYPLSASAHADLANAFLLDGQIQKAKMQYQRVAALSPGNYYLELMKEHPDSMVSIRLKGFAIAKNVTLNIKQSHSQEEKQLKLLYDPAGYWSCSVKLPAGNYAYNFKVDDAWITDPANQLAERNGDYWNSFLPVRL